MRVWTLLLTALILSACAGKPSYPDPDWDLAAPTTTEVKDAVPLPLLCNLTLNGFWSEECWNVFEGYEEVAERNTTAAQAYADTTRNAEQVQREIIDSAKAQQELSNWRRELYEAEKSARKWDAWFYRFLAAAALALGVAL